MTCVTDNKMADGREDERATSSRKFKIVQISLIHSYVKKFVNAAASSARSSWTSVLYAPRVGFLLMCGFVLALSVSSPVINIQ